jgi:hypothetical protein
MAEARALARILWRHRASSMKPLPLPLPREVVPGARTNAHGLGAHPITGEG